LNNCIVQGEITSIYKVKFSYYDKLKAVLVIYIAISCDVCNIMECRIYDKDIDMFLDKYKLDDICILSGSLRNEYESKKFNLDYLFVKQIY
jgi:hypothetical protein